MLCVVVVFGVHSFIDWTWYVPGNAGVALLFAGWLAGRGPLEPEQARAAARTSWRSGWTPALLRVRLAEAGPVRLGVALAVIVAALLAVWSQWQPQRSEDRAPAGARARRQPPASGTRHSSQLRQPRSALGAGAVRALGGPAGSRRTGAGPGDAAAGGATAALKSRKLAASGALRTARQPARSAERHRSGDLPRPPVDRARADQRAARIEQVDRNPERLHPGAARVLAQPQKRERTARASRRRRAPGIPAAGRTSISWKRKSSSSSLRESRV